MAESPLQESFYNYEYLLVCGAGVVPSLLVQKNNKWEEEILFEWQKAGSHIYNVFVLRCPSNRGRSARNNQHWYNIRSSALFEHTSCVCKHTDLCGFRQLKKLKNIKSNFPCRLGRDDPTNPYQAHSTINSPQCQELMVWRIFSVESIFLSPLRDEFTL